MGMQRAENGPTMVEEFLFTLSQSKKMQVYLILTLVAPVSIFVLGIYMTAGVQFSGPLAPYTDFFREKILHRCDKGALMVFALFIGATFKSYRWEHRRRYGVSS